MLLAIDTSTRSVGLALYDGIRVVSEHTWWSQEYHTVELAPAIERLLGQSKASVHDLTVIAVATGPGSFTGLRIGLALAKGIALAGHLDLVGIPTLDILAASQPVSDIRLAAVLQAGRGRLAVGWYRQYMGHWVQDGKSEILDGQQLSERITEPTWICGELSESERRLLLRKRKNAKVASPAYCTRRPSFLAELGWQKWREGYADDPATLVPTYLHFDQSIPVS
jgi:tRNA threonylcarbamoyladenosine biosynthesis protein TsaB